MEPNVLLSDFAVPLNTGVTPGSAAVGTVSGAKLTLSTIAVNPFRKLTYRLGAYMGTAAGTVTLQIFTASIASGTYASIANLSATLNASVSTNFYMDQIEIRTDALADLGLGSGAGIMPVITIATTATPIFLDALAWNAGSQPARRSLVAGQISNVVVSEADFMGVTTGGPPLQPIPG